jgi:hypothetical protein
VRVAHVGKDGKVAGSAPFLTGFLDGQKTLGRPVDVQPLRDGSLLVSDDYNGAVYRITYAPAGRAQTRAQGAASIGRFGGTASRAPWSCIEQGGDRRHLPPEPCRGVTTAP